MTSMASALTDPLRHNAWATRELLAFCRSLTPDQLQATSEGNYGTILATFQHMIGADGRYVSRLVGEPFPWPVRPEDTEHLGDLERMAGDAARAWDDVASGDFDPERLVSWIGPDGERYEARAGILVAQALNHGNEHRAQIFTILTTIGVQPPDLDGFSYAIATGRFTELPAPS